MKGNVTVWLCDRGSRGLITFALGGRGMLERIHTTRLVALIAVIRKPPTTGLTATSRRTKAYRFTSRMKSLESDWTACTQNTNLLSSTLRYRSDGEEYPI